jgi:hypothetical protein
MADPFVRASPKANAVPKRLSPKVVRAGAKPPSPGWNGLPKIQACR